MDNIFKFWSFMSLIDLPTEPTKEAAFKIKQFDYRDNTRYHNFKFLQETQFSQQEHL